MAVALWSHWVFRALAACGCVLVWLPGLIEVRQVRGSFGESRAARSYADIRLAYMCRRDTSVPGLCFLRTRTLHGRWGYGTRYSVRKSARGLRPLSGQRGLASC